MEYGRVFKMIIKLVLVLVFIIGINDRICNVTI